MRCLVLALQFMYCIAAVPCHNKTFTKAGTVMVPEFPLNTYLLSQTSFGPALANDITGFKQGEREFAVLGLTNGAEFVDVTDPSNPFSVGFIPGGTSSWRDLKYWDRHVYVGTEANDGIKVVSVENPDNPGLVYTIEDAAPVRLGPLDNTHNIHVYDGYLYVCGSDLAGLLIYDISTPELPVPVGWWGQDAASEDYCHDVEVYNNRAYCAHIYTRDFTIIDVQDKANPQQIARYDTGEDFPHDCAVTSDEKYLFIAFEKEDGIVKVYDIEGTSNIQEVGEYTSGASNSSPKSVHNIYVDKIENLLIASYYADGTRVVDISNIPDMTEVGHYDTTGSTGPGPYVGNWGTYTDLPSGNIVSSDIELSSLFVLKYAPDADSIASAISSGGTTFLARSDVNADALKDILDATRVIYLSFPPSSPPPPPSPPLLPSVPLGTVQGTLSGSGAQFDPIAFGCTGTISEVRIDATFTSGSGNTWASDIAILASAGDTLDDTTLYILQAGGYVNLGVDASLWEEWDDAYDNTTPQSFVDDVTFNYTPSGTYYLWIGHGYPSGGPSEWTYTVNVTPDIQCQPATPRQSATAQVSNPVMKAKAI